MGLQAKQCKIANSKGFKGTPSNSSPPPPSFWPLPHVNAFPFKPKKKMLFQIMPVQTMTPSEDSSPEEATHTYLTEFLSLPSLPGQLHHWCPQQILTNLQEISKLGARKTTDSAGTGCGDYKHLWFQGSRDASKSWWKLVYYISRRWIFRITPWPHSYIPQYILSNLLASFFVSVRTIANIYSTITAAFAHGPRKMQQMVKIPINVCSGAKHPL